MVESGTIPPWLLNIKNKETEELATEVGADDGDSKTARCVRRCGNAKRRLELPVGGKGKPPEHAEVAGNRDLAAVPKEELGSPPLTKSEVEEILGFGPEGVDPRQLSNYRSVSQRAGPSELAFPDEGGAYALNRHPHPV